MIRQFEFEWAGACDTLPADPMTSAQLYWWARGLSAHLDAASRCAMARLRWRWLFRSERVEGPLGPSFT